VEDNTDPRHQCPGLCSSCYGGACGPAAPGTDPRQECGPGQVCALDQSCRITDGGACDAGSVCAENQCILGGCVSAVSVSLDAYINPQATDAEVRAVAANPRGDEAIVLQDLAATFDPDTGLNVYQFDKLHLLAHRAGADWTELELYDQTANDNNLSATVADAVPVYLGRALFVVAVLPIDEGAGQCLAPGGKCGVVAIPVDDTLGIDATSAETYSLSVQVDASGNLGVAYGDRAGLHYASRGSDASHTWTRIDLAPPPDRDPDVFALAQLGGAPILIYGSGDGSTVVNQGHLLALDGGELLTLDQSTGFPCPGDEALFQTAHGSSADGAAHFIIACADASYVAQVDGSSPLQLSVQALSGAGLAGGGPGAVLAEGPNPRAAWLNAQSAFIAPLDGSSRYDLYDLTGELSPLSIDLALGVAGLPTVVFTVGNTSSQTPMPGTMEVHLVRLRL
jgi:hypothetical protein